MKPATAIIGRGNVATHLAAALAAGAQVTMVNPRTLEGMPPSPDFCIIAVSDNAIADVAARLANLDCIVAHTSGTTGIEVLQNAGIRRPGVFYPLQTFTKGVPLKYDEIPVFVEGATPDTEWMLRELATVFTPHVRHADSATRRRLHLASVYACNFVNHLWTIAEDTLHPEGLGLDVLYPLMRETLRKAIANGPAPSQTGPARRNDSRTLDAHLNIIDTPEYKQIYQLLTSSIQKYHECH